MPTYEYECQECGHRFEVFQQMSDAPIAKCENCSGEVKRLIFGGSGVIFKGSGFYINDSSKSKENAKKVKSDKNVSIDTNKKEKKSETKKTKTKTNTV